MPKKHDPNLKGPSLTLTHLVQEAEIDELNHVYNVHYLEWILKAAVAHSEHVGFDRARFESIGLAFVVKRHEIDYLRPAVLGDEILMETWLESWSSASCFRRTIIKRKRDDRELAKGLTTWVMVCDKTGRPKRIPEVIKEAFLGDQYTP